MSRTSAATGQTCAPSARSSSAAASSLDCVRPQIATLAPSAAKFLATPRLMPLPPPVHKHRLALEQFAWQQALDEHLMICLHDDSLEA